MKRIQTLFSRRHLTAAVSAVLLGAGSVANAAPDAAQTAALTALYNATKGVDWTLNDNWNSGDACTWSGVVCDTAGNNVVKLELNNNNLQGSLPAEIGNFPALRELLISDNSISGTIPAEIGNLSSLTRLIMDDNMFSGEIPAEIGNLRFLNTLRLGGNELSGAVPAALTNLNEMLQLTLHRNALVGELPAGMINYSDLVEIRLDWNALHTSDASLQSMINSAYVSDDGTTDFQDTQTLDAQVLENLTEAGTTTAIVYWNQTNTTPSTAGGYNIYLSSSVNGPWTLAKTVTTKNTDTAELTGLSAGTTYFVQVRSYTDSFTDGSKFYHDLPAPLESSGELYAPMSFTTSTGGEEVSETDTDTSTDDSSGGGGAAWLLALAGVFGLRRLCRD